MKSMNRLKHTPIYPTKTKKQQPITRYDTQYSNNKALFFVSNLRDKSAQGYNSSNASFIRKLHHEFPIAYCLYKIHSWHMPL